MQRVLITGAAGRLGRVLRNGLAKPERILRLLDIAQLGSPREREEIWTADATNLAEMVDAMAGVDVVVHLAAYPEEAPWETIFPLNYSLTYAVFEAAHRAGVKRVVFASSVQAVGFHPLETTLDATARIRPSGYYGVSKAFGEALASLYADKYVSSASARRIITSTSFTESPRTPARAWTTPMWTGSDTSPARTQRTTSKTSSETASPWVLSRAGRKEAAPARWVSRAVSRRP